MASVAAQPAQPAQPAQQTVLFAAITDGRNETSLYFAVSAMRMQTDAALRQAVRIEFNFYETINAALNAFLAGPYATAVVVTTRISFSAAFVHTAIESPSPFVTGVYPLPSIDWARVGAKADTPETPSFKGNTYNVDPVELVPVAGGYLAANAARLGAFVLKREVVERIAAAHPELAYAGRDTAGPGSSGDGGGGVLFAAETIAGGRALAPDLSFCRLWTALSGQKIMADADNPLSNFGPCEYTGCVGLRQVLR